MAYRLDPERSVQSGLRKIAAKQLRSARDELRRAMPPRDEAIHEARKRVKKARAILELIDADAGAAAVAAKRLHRISAMLSRLRDADAMIAMLETLGRRNRTVLSGHTVARIRRRLTAHKRAAMQAATDAKAWLKIDRQLRRLRRGAKRWSLRDRGFDALAPGLRDTYRRGRKAMGQALDTQQATDFHEWRKAMKTLWYLLRLVDSQSRAVRSHADALHRAETWLGDDQNVVVLCAELAKDASVCGGQTELDRIQIVAHRYQCELRRKAIDRMRPLYARKAGAFVKSMKHAWKDHRRRQTKRRRPARRAA